MTSILYMHTYVYTCVQAYNERLHMHTHKGKIGAKFEEMLETALSCYRLADRPFPISLLLARSFFSLETFHLTSLRFPNPQDRHDTAYLTG